MPTNWSTANALADKRREQLLEIYGNKCAECGTTDEHLQINHLYGRDWEPRRTSRYGRFLRYFREAREGRINLLCPSCNARYKPQRNRKPLQPCPLFLNWIAANNPF